MTLEIIGMAVIIVVWLLDMNRRLKNPDMGYYRFLLFYIVGFGVLGAYFAQNNNTAFAFFFIILALVSILEFAFMLSKRK
jgi:hypothetical protein